ncbi:hypothetical protein [Vallitalea guaymasensis]|uniref:hypothetical protein n=1 Tax=Vallitalea guaymasensis TaxID=1185412 RepID=UPI000DE38D30|nr:hypothetical protein [Vallitalea guaymasensis]
MKNHQYIEKLLKNYKKIKNLRDIKRHDLDFFTEQQKSMKAYPCTKDEYIEELSLKHSEPTISSNVIYDKTYNIMLNIDLAFENEEENILITNDKIITRRIKEMKRELEIFDYIIQKVDIGLQTLSEINRKILIDKMMHQLSYDDIAYKYNRSYDGVQKIGSKAIRELTKLIYINLIRDFVDKYL